MHISPEANSNIKEIQLVRGFIPPSFIALVFALYLIFSPFVDFGKRHLPTYQDNKLEILAYQIAAVELKKAGGNEAHLLSNRATASLAKIINKTGFIGKNRLGQPYQYEIGESAGFIRIVLWSKHDFSDRTEVLIPSEKR